LWREKSDYVDPSKIQLSVQAFRHDYYGEMSYVDEETQDKVSTILKVRLDPIERLSEKEKSLITHRSHGNGIQLLSPESVDPARPLMNGYKYASIDNNLELLGQWLGTCVTKHSIEAEAENCRRPLFHGDDARPDYGIRVIDVHERTIVEKTPEEIEYAALSYVWDAAHRNSKVPVHNVDSTNKDSVQGSLSKLPDRIPKVIEDAIFVCRKLSIPYLWVDRYCINQSDLLSKGSEINGMAFRYLYAKLTIIAGMYWNPDSDSEIGLLPAPDEMEKLQRIETIQGRKYITALPSIMDQIHGSQWHRRAWTMQEGQLANRCAFFGGSGITFLCGQGDWTACLHNGPYGHDAAMKGLKTDSRGYYVLSWLNWMQDKTWRFEDYEALLNSYTTRELSFESDKLNAITGCLNFITEVKDVPFIYGLPTLDFHYALLWHGEYDRPREGFPSWSWAGWHSLQNRHIIFPTESSTCSLKEDAKGVLQTVGPISPDIEMGGLLIELAERPHPKNKCLQRFADITFPSYRTEVVLSITAEIAHFAIDVVPVSPEPKDNLFKSPYLEIPTDFDSTSPSSSPSAWILDSEYRTPYARLHLRDSSNNISQYHYPRWYDKWPPVKLNWPKTLLGSTLEWLLKEGIDLIMILEIKVLEADEGLRPFHVVLCLGLDRRQQPASRMGIFCLPKEVWEKAGPKMGTVMLG
jgi:hypothetical protein